MKERESDGSEGRREGRKSGGRHLDGWLSRSVCVYVVRTGVDGQSGRPERGCTRYICMCFSVPVSVRVPVQIYFNLYGITLCVCVCVFTSLYVCFSPSFCQPLCRSISLCSSLPACPLALASCCMCVFFCACLPECSMYVSLYVCLHARMYVCSKYFAICDLHARVYLRTSLCLCVSTCVSHTDVSLSYTGRSWLVVSGVVSVRLSSFFFHDFFKYENTFITSQFAKKEKSKKKSLIRHFEVCSLARRGNIVQTTT